LGAQAGIESAGAATQEVGAVPLSRAKSEVDILERVAEGVHVDVHTVRNHASADKRQEARQSPAAADRDTRAARRESGRREPGE
jgi:hypothetical protein